MAHLSEKASELSKIYIEKFKKPPRGWNHGIETMKEYEEYLQNEIENK